MQKLQYCFAMIESIKTTSASAKVIFVRHTHPANGSLAATNLWCSESPFYSGHYASELTLAQAPQQ